jgi:hypothetical protein
LFVTKQFWLIVRTIEGSIFVLPPAAAKSPTSFFTTVQFSSFPSQRAPYRATLYGLNSFLKARTRLLDHFSGRVLQGRKVHYNSVRVANCCRAYWHNLFTQFASAARRSAADDSCSKSAFDKLCCTKVDGCNASAGSEKFRPDRR